jgi:hypothetical protein
MREGNARENQNILQKHFHSDYTLRFGLNELPLFDFSFIVRINPIRRGNAGPAIELAALFGKQLFERREH